MNLRKSELSGIGFLLKIKKRSKGKGYNSGNFFKKFIEKAIIDLKANNIANSVNNDKFENVLINEIQKKIGFEKKKKKELNKTVSEEKKQIYNYFVNLPPRNIDKIIFCLRKLDKFNEFIKFNNITYEILEKIAAYIKFQYVSKGQFLFSIGKRAKKFFCIINGCISLRTIDPSKIKEQERIKNMTRQNDNNQNDLENYEEKKIKSLRDFGITDDNDNQENEKEEKENIIREYEIKKCTKGMCLCEWDIIRKRLLTENAYALEDTNVFYLEKEYFEKILSSPIVRSDIERKYFIIAKIPILTLENLSNIQPEFYNKNDIIYTEFDNACEAILIYKGSAALATFKNAINKKDIYDRRKELKIITKIERGGLAGLEIGKTNTDKEEIFYENTLIATDDSTIIFRLNIEILKGKSKKLERSLNRFFNELYTQQSDFINNLKSQSEKMIKISKQNKEEEMMKNVNKLFDSLLKPKIELKETKLEKKITQINISKTNTEINNSKNDDINNLRIKKNKRNKTLTLVELKQHSKSTEQNSKIFLSNEVNGKYLKNKGNKLILRRNYNNDIIRNPSQSNYTISNYNIYCKNIEAKKVIKIEPFSENKNFIFSNNKFQSFENKKSINQKNIFNLRANVNKRIENKQFYDDKNNTKNFNKYFYDSGKFKIPLISLDNNQ